MDMKHVNNPIEISLNKCLGTFLKQELIAHEQPVLNSKSEVFASSRPGTKQERKPWRISSESSNMVSGYFWIKTHFLFTPKEHSG